MNLELLDPFRNSFPEVIEETLEEGFATTCAFNRWGTLLATGCHDGRVIIWDFDTRGIAKVLTGHIHPITSVSWSRSGRFLLSSSTDWTIHCYEVLTGNLIKSVQFDSPILHAQMHPRNSNFCIVCPHMDYPVVVDLATGNRTPLPEMDEDERDAQEYNKKGAPKNNNPLLIYATYNKQGDKIYTGNNKGIISVIDTATMEMSYHFKVPGGAPIKSIHFSRSGRQFIVNSTDQKIRFYETEESRTVAREYQDPVNRLQWKKCCFSCDGEYIIGGSAQKSQHNIYIWNKEMGQLEKTLEGPKEGIMDLVWHPSRPVIASLSTAGVVYIWASNYTENWSAFAPDFKEFEENEDYIEKEDEFDIIEEEEDRKKKRKQVEDSVLVDIVNNDKISYFSSEGEDDLLFIPIQITKE